MSRMVQCVKLGREAEGLDRPTIPAIWVLKSITMCQKKPGLSG